MTAALPSNLARPDSAHRRLSALFRARARRLVAGLDGELAPAARLLPALFHASFPVQQLRTDPPGVEHVRASLSWTRLARAVELPAPTGIQRGRRLVAALLVSPRAQGLEVFVVPIPRLTPLEEQRIAHRARAVETQLRRLALPITITGTGPSGQPYDAANRSRLLAFGGLLAGRLPADYFAPDTPVADPLASELWLTAPNELARTLSLLTLEPWPAGEPAELQEVADLAKAAKLPIARFAEPGLFTAARAALRSRRPWIPLSLCALGSSSGERRSPWALARHLCRDPLPESIESPSAPLVLEVAFASAVELASAVRRAPRAMRQELARHLWREVMPAGVPEVLAPILRLGLKRAAVSGDALPLSETWGSRRVEVKLGASCVLARGTREAQAWVRATALLTRATGKPVASLGYADDWRRLAPRLVATVSRRTVWIQLDPREGSGPPFDPLNRGPKRELAFGDATVVLLRPNGRASARVLPARALVHFVLGEASRGTKLEFASGTPEAQRVEARLTRLAQLAARAHGALTVEVGGEMQVLRQGQLRRYAERRYAKRPVRTTCDPEAPDLGAAATQGRLEAPGPQQLTCLAWSDDGATARLAWSDSSGWLFREEVPLAVAEAWLSEARELLRAPPIRALSVRVDNGLEQASISTPQPVVEPAELALRGRWPGSLEVRIGEEWFGGRNPLGWGAAASTVLSRWPSGARGALRFVSIEVEGGGAIEPGLFRLYVRSVAARRLLAHMRTLTAT